MGYSNRQTELAIDRLDRLHRVVPKLNQLGIVGNGGVKNVNLEMQKLVARAKQFKIKTVVVDVRKASQIAPKIKALRGKVDALFVCTDPFVTTHHIAINIAAAAADLPTIHAFREYVEGGGWRRTGRTSASCSKVPPISSIRFCAGRGRVRSSSATSSPAHELVINRSTAAALGVKIPRGLKATMIG